MKRGLIRWDRAELPAEAFEARLAALDALCEAHEVPALVAYSDVSRSNDVRYISNYMPYWNRALTVVPRREKPILLCALSPRVYPWIRTVTLHETIIASPSLPAQLHKLCTERRWTRAGVVDRQGLPSDLYAQLDALPITYVDIPHSSFRPSVTDAEIAMHRRAAALARQALEAEVTRAATGITDYELTGRLEKRLRRAGIEDLAVLISDGSGVPYAAAGRPVSEGTSVSVALEYSGHWARLSRNVAGITAPLPPPQANGVRRELLSVGYPWQEVGAEGLAGLAGQAGRDRQAITSIQVMIPHDNTRLYYGDTGVEGSSGWQIL